MYMSVSLALLMSSLHASCSLCHVLRSLRKIEEYDNAHMPFAFTFPNFCGLKLRSNSSPAQILRIIELLAILYHGGPHHVTDTRARVYQLYEGSNIPTEKIAQETSRSGIGTSSQRKIITKKTLHQTHLRPKPSRQHP